MRTAEVYYNEMNEEKYKGHVRIPTKYIVVLHYKPCSGISEWIPRKKTDGTQYMEKLMVFQGMMMARYRKDYSSDSDFFPEYWKRPIGIQHFPMRRIVNHLLKRKKGKGLNHWDIEYLQVILRLDNPRGKSCCKIFSAIPIKEEQYLKEFVKDEDSLLEKVLENMLEKELEKVLEAWQVEAKPEGEGKPKGEEEHINNIDDIGLTEEDREEVSREYGEQIRKEYDGG